MKKIVVTGGGGLLGRYVVAALESDYEVTVLDTKGDSPIDVLDLAAVSRMLEGQDAVIHLAGIDVAVPAEDEAYFRTNVMGTWNVLHAAERAGHRKAVICSSVSAVGFSDEPPVYAPEYLPVDEAHPCRPTHPYGLSKQVMEDIGRSFAKRGALPIVAVRPALVVYPHIVADVERRVEEDDGEPGAAPGDATVSKESLSPTRCYVRPEDAARLFRLALERDTGPYETFFASADDSYSPEATLAGLERRFGAVPELRDPAYFERDERVSALTNAKAKRLLGWQPTGTWREVLAAL